MIMIIIGVGGLLILTAVVVLAIKIWFDLLTDLP